MQIKIAYDERYGQAVFTFTDLTIEQTENAMKKITDKVNALYQEYVVDGGRSGMPALGEVDEELGFTWVVGDVYSAECFLHERTLNIYSFMECSPWDFEEFRENNWISVLQIARELLTNKK